MSVRAALLFAVIVSQAFGCGGSGSNGGGVEDAHATPVEGSTPASAGTVKFVKAANAAFDVYTQNPTTAQRQWMREHYWRMRTYSPYFDSRLAWFPDAWVYKDLYAIYTDSALATEHPEWILRDAAGNSLYIPFACAGGTCPQYAADVGDPGFRAYWIDATGATLAKGYRGLFIDDVNMTISRVGNGAGQPVAPTDPRTGRTMTDTDWRRYVAEFTEQIAAAFPQIEIVHNALWFLGHDDASIQRQLMSADIIEVERGVNDAGLRGAGTFGLPTLFAHIDWLHARGKNVLFDATAASNKAREYGLAGWFLIDTGGDALGNDPGGTPDDWWPGYDVALGPALGPRYAWSDVIRRDFDRGIVLLNPPEAPARTVIFTEPVTGLDGTLKMWLTLGPAEGAVLRRVLPSLGG